MRRMESYLQGVFCSRKNFKTAGKRTGGRRWEYMNIKRRSAINIKTMQAIKNGVESTTIDIVE